MNVLGIIAEYNPFHNGHAFQMEACKKIAGADYVIVVMSGNYTQRGEAASADKFIRTTMALAGGADAVIELPVHTSCASAGYFAAGGISLLKHTHIVTHLGFGSESGDIRHLKEISDMISVENPPFKSALLNALKNGMTYALARQEALKAVCPDAEHFLTPNNILALEYIHAIQVQNAPMIPVTVPRQKTGYHDLSLTEDICSASALRHAGRHIVFSKYMPETAASLYRKNLSDGAFVTNNDFSDMLYYALMSSDEYTDIFDIDEALSNRIRKCRNEFTDFGNFCSLLKSRNYTYTRICRAMFHLIFNMTNEQVNHMMVMDYAPYIRLLGFRKSARPLLSALKAGTDIPIITKAADAASLLAPGQADIFQKNLFADQLYRQIQGRLTKTAVPHEFSRGVVLFD